MAEYIVSARKYRPTRFSEMVGQEQVATTLKNAIRTGQLAHSFLFCGPRGVGKTTAARILAKTINCENITADFEACGKCQSCISFQQNASFNIHELDAASNNSVDDIRALVDQVRFPPQSGKYKIYIIDEVHMLSAGAFNAFLKTLEEPPAYCKFILATTEKHKILPTILSRCQIFDFKRISQETIVQHLKHICKVEKIEAEEDALHIIAQKADGGMRDALSIFDRLSSFSGGKLTYAAVLDNLNVLDYDYYFKVTESLLAENLPQVLQLLDEILRKGFEGDDFILGLCEHFRNLLFCKDERTLKLMEHSETLKQRYAAQSALAPADFLVNCLQLGNQCDVQYKASKNKRLTVELALIKMCYVNMITQVEASKKKPEPENSLKQEEQIVPKAEVQTPDNSLNQKPAAEITPNVAAPAPLNPKGANTAFGAQQVILPKTKKLITLESLDNDEQVIATINDMIAKDLEPQEILVLNAENVNNLWDEFTAHIFTEKKGLKIILTHFKPVWNKATPDRLDVTVKSDIQKAQIDEMKPRLQEFFSAKTGVKMLLEVAVDKAPTNGTKPYTPKEKLERLIEKNPAIKKMQQQLGLELEYD